MRKWLIYDLYKTKTKPIPISRYWKNETENRHRSKITDIDPALDYSTLKLIIVNWRLVAAVLATNRVWLAADILLRLRLQLQPFPRASENKQMGLLGSYTVQILSTKPTKFAGNRSTPRWGRDERIIHIFEKCIGFVTNIIILSLLSKVSFAPSYIHINMCIILKHIRRATLDTTESLWARLNGASSPKLVIVLVWHHVQDARQVHNNI